MNVSTSIALSATNIHKSFGDAHVLRGISLDAHEGDVISILGASGSGKSTFLRCINLLEMPNSGEVVVKGELIRMRRLRDGTQQPADAGQVKRIRRELGMVFQQFNLWSHMTVVQNLVAAPMHVLGLSRREATERAEAMLDKVGLNDKRDAYPIQLSGASSSGWALPAPYAWSRACCCLTSPPRRWIRSLLAKCWP